MEIGFIRGADFDLIAMQGIAPGRALDVQFAISGTLQAVGQFPDAQGLPGGNSHRRGVDSCGGLLDMPGKARIDHLAVGNPIIGEDSGGGQQHQQRQPNQNQANVGCQKTAFNPNYQAISPFRRETRSSRIAEGCPVPLDANTSLVYTASQKIFFKWRRF